jgi:hypothetical protein
MPNKFSKEDAQTCFRCGTKPPSFRMVSLARMPNEHGSLVPECITALLCSRCVWYELHDFHQSLNQVNIPFGTDEEKESFLCRQVSICVIPLSLTYMESNLLVEGLKADWLECVVN